MEKYKQWLEQQIERCLNDKDLQREHWAFCKAYEKFTALRKPPVMCRFLFQYRSMGKDLMVHIEASSLNDAMVKFATHYHLIDEVYEIAKVS